MDITDWANRKWKEQAERDPALEKIYLSARMMKWHPLITKDLRKAYGLLASAAMRAMSPDYKFMVKRKFNKTNTAMKYMREEAKFRKAKYGPIAKRNIATRAAFWNYLVDKVRVTDPDVAAELSGYDTAAFKSGEWYKYGDGALGRANTLAEYNAMMDRKREARREQMHMLTEEEKRLIRAKRKLWNAGRKAARDAIKAEKEKLLAGETTIGMNRFNTKKLEDYYKAAWDALREKEPDYYSGVSTDDMLAAYRTGQPINWLDEFFSRHADRTLENIPQEPVWRGTNLTDRTQPLLVEYQDTEPRARPDIRTRKQIAAEEAQRAADEAYERGLLEGQRQGHAGGPPLRQTPVAPSKKRSKATGPRRGPSGKVVAADDDDDDDVASSAAVQAMEEDNGPSLTPVLADTQGPGKGYGYGYGYGYVYY